MKNYYEILGLNTDASKEDIRAAYRKLSLKIHPDVNDGDAFFSEFFKNINEAHDVLSHDDKRAEYDAASFAESVHGQEEIEREDLLKKQFEEQKVREHEHQREKFEDEQKARQSQASMIGKMMDEIYVPRKKEIKKVSFPWFTVIFMATIAVLAVTIYNKPHDSRSPAAVAEKPTHLIHRKKKKKDEYIAEERKLDEEMQKRNENKIVTIDSESINVNVGN